MYFKFIILVFISTNLSAVIQEIKSIQLIENTYIKASNTDSGDRFGFSVDIFGDTMVVGAPYESSSSTGVNNDQTDNNGFFSGAVYVYVKNNNNQWEQQAYIKPLINFVGGGFGSAVAIYGETIVISASGAEDAAFVDLGGNITPFTYRTERVYVYTRTLNQWHLQAVLRASNFNEGDFFSAADRFGFSVDISGDTIVVGAPAESSNSQIINGDGSNNSSTFSGAAYIFKRESEQWLETAYLKASNADRLDLFGWSVAIDNDKIIVGTRGEDSDGQGVNSDGNNNSARSSGAAYVFTKENNIWNQQAYLKSSDSSGNNQFGWSVDISEENIIVGAKGVKIDNGVINDGAAYLFNFNGSEWVETSKLLGDNTETEDQFGISVAIEGNVAVVGAILEDSNINDPDITNNLTSQSGAAYIFTKTTDVWETGSIIKAANMEINDEFGHSIAISESTIVVGVPKEDSNSNSINGDGLNNDFEDSGAAYVYDVNTNDFGMQAGHSALWFNPLQSGHGINVYMLEGNRIVVIWYVYDNSGTPIWLLGIGTHDGEKAILDVNFNEGAMFPPNFNSNDVNTTAWGKFELSFSSCNEGLFKWQPISGNGFTSGETHVTRLINTKGLSCDQNFTKNNDLKIVVQPTINSKKVLAFNTSYSALWFNPQQSGHGINVYMLEDNRIVVIWYVYDDSGNPIWLLGIGTHDGEKAILDVNFNEGAMFPPNFNSNDVITSTWGTFELEFSGCNSGQFKWLPENNNGFNAGEMSITRLTNTLGLECLE